MFGLIRYAGGTAGDHPTLFLFLLGVALFLAGLPWLAAGLWLALFVGRWL